MGRYVIEKLVLKIEAKDICELIEAVEGICKDWSITHADLELEAK